MEAKVDIRTLIPLGKVEDLLSIILDRLNRHEETLTHLSQTVTTLVTSQAAEKRFDEIYKEMNKLRARIEVVEEAATAHVEDKRIPCGELTTQNFKMLKRIHNELSTTAKQADVDTSLRILTEQHRTELTALRQATAPLPLANSLQSSLNGLHRQVHHLEEHLSDKLDRSEVNQLHILSEQLTHHLHQHNSLVANMHDLEEQLTSTTNITTQHSEEISTITSQVKQVQQNSSRYSTKIEVRTVAKELTKLEGDIQLLASNAAMEKLSSRVTNSERQLVCAHETLLSCALEQKKTSAILDTKADASLLQNYVPIKQFVSVSTALRDELDTKADNSIQCAHAKTLEQNDAVLIKHDHELAIAMRFIEWFTHRGEMYEQNMKIIDKHLKNLSTAAINGPEIPYAGRVRMQPVMTPGEGFFDLKK